MAFRVPTQLPRRQTTYSQEPPTFDTSPSFSQAPDDESTHWVLFSPSQEAASDAAHTRSASTERTPRTTGPSRLSDFGSFGTPTQSGTGVESAEDDDDDDDKDVLDSVDEDGTELDSLDDGLHAFPHPSLTQATVSRWDQGVPAVLPAHDGLGSFMASSQTVQEQLWQYEQFNPRRRPEVQARRMSIIRRQLDTVAESEEVDVERERWERIERWRMDQSRALLREVERETRRRRRNSRVSLTSDKGVTRSPVATGSLQDTPETSKGVQSSETETEEYETFWQRITRKFIKDLIGIDDSLLSVILGESLPEDQQQQQEENNARSRADAQLDGPWDLDAIMNWELDSLPNFDQQHWQTKLLQRVARELGILIHQFVGHPGAFTTYLQLSEGISSEYAGMPVGHLAERTSLLNRSSSDAATTTASADSANNLASIPSPYFTPTLRDANGGPDHAAQWGIEDEDANRNTTTTEDPSSESTRLQQEQEYWERELDVMMVFRYLRSRFSRGGNDDVDYGNPNNTTINNNHNNIRMHNNSNTSSYTLQDPSRRAAIIRQHHPLVAHAHSRSQAQTRHQSQLQQYGSPLSAQNGISRQRLHRSSSSCASQSAKLSALSGKRTLTGSSRNYWDIGGSVESGSAISPVAASVGAWGDI